MYSALADLDVERGWGEVIHTCHADVGVRNSAATDPCQSSTS